MEVEEAKEQTAQVVIKPAIGRKLWFYTGGSPVYDACSRQEIWPTTMSDQPIDATVIYVWGDRLVNLDCTDHAGNRFVATSVTLVQEGDWTPPGNHCRWMPFQVGQAKKS